MYILHNALANVWRHKGRNALLGAIILVVIAASVIALMISSTATRIIDDYKERFSAEVTFVPDMEKVREEAMAGSTDGMVRMTMPTIDADQYLAFGESEHLADAVFTASTGVVPEDITPVAADLGGGTGMMMMGGGPGGPTSEDEPMSFLASLQGDNFADFEDGSRALADGEMPDAEGEALVSTELAELNDLAVGDTLHLEGELRGDPEEGSVEPIEYDVTVVGTYDDLTEEYGTAQQQNAFTNRRNEILTTYDTVLANYVAGMQGMRVSATFYLADPDLLDAFTQEVRGEGLPDVFDVTTDSATYEAIVGPVEGLKSVSVTFMVVVLVFGGIIIALLSSIAIRERKYEIGVLRAMGMKKAAVGLGLWSETLAVTTACLLLGLVVGSFVAQPVTDVLLAGQIEAAEEAAAAAEAQGSGGGMGMPMGPMGGGNQADPDAEPLADLAVALTPGTVGQIAGVALGLATLAGLVSLGRITRYEPIKILSERN